MQCTSTAFNEETTHKTDAKYLVNEDKLTKYRLLDTVLKELICCVMRPLDSSSSSI